MWFVKYCYILWINLFFTCRRFIKAYNGTCIWCKAKWIHGPITLWCVWFDAQRKHLKKNKISQFNSFNEQWCKRSNISIQAAFSSPTRFPKGIKINARIVKKMVLWSKISKRKRLETDKIFSNNPIAPRLTFPIHHKHAKHVPEAYQQNPSICGMKNTGTILILRLLFDTMDVISGERREKSDCA